MLVTLYERKSLELYINEATAIYCSYTNKGDAYLCWFAHVINEVICLGYNWQGNNDSMAQYITANFARQVAQAG